MKRHYAKLIDMSAKPAMILILVHINFCVTMDWGKRRYVWIMRKKLSRINHMKQMYIIIVDMHMKQMVIYLMHMNNI